MSLLTGFIPFAIFAVLEHFTGLATALFAAAAASLASIAADLLRRRSPKPMEIGSILVFGGLGLYACRFAPAWSIFEIRLYVDAGLLSLVLASVACGRPFTLAYAREKLPRAAWTRPLFMQANRAISLAWAAAFAVLVAADVVMAYVPQVPLGAGILVSVAALFLATRYSLKHARAAVAAAGSRGGGEVATSR